MGTITSPASVFVTLYLLQISIVPQDQRWGLCQDYCLVFELLLNFFFFLLQIPLKVLNRNLLSSQRDKRQLFLSESSAHRLALMQSALHIFFVFLPPSAAVKTENSKSHSRVFLLFFFRVVSSNVTSSTCPTFLLHFDTNLRLSPLPPSLFHQSTTLILWIPLIVVCVIQTVFSARCSAVCVSFLGLLCCPVRRKSRNFGKSVRIRIFDAVDARLLRQSKRVTSTRVGIALKVKCRTR